MSNKENNANFEWVWYVIGMLAFVFATMAVTFNFLCLLAAAVAGLIFGGIFLNKIVKGRVY
jgi:hypothetical protein